MDELIEVTITARDATWLASFVRQLVEDRLCAAGHVDPSIRSIYRWQDEIFDVPESRATLHTRASLLDAIIERVNERHPYEVPCVVAKNFTGGSDPYLRWIVAVTGDEDQDHEVPDRGLSQPSGGA